MFLALLNRPETHYPHSQLPASFWSRGVACRFPTAFRYRKCHPHELIMASFLFLSMLITSDSSADDGLTPAEHRTADTAMLAAREHQVRVPHSSIGLRGELAFEIEDFQVNHQSFSSIVTIDPARGPDLVNSLITGSSHGQPLAPDSSEYD